jgi:uncharacterized protein YjiS (DUF1127 family)
MSHNRKAWRHLLLGVPTRQATATSVRVASYHDGRSGWDTRFLRWCARCSARSRQRQALAKLDDRLLEDIGVTRQQAIAEAGKPSWK